MEQHDPDRTQFIPQSTRQPPYPQQQYRQPQYQVPAWASGQQPAPVRGHGRILGAIVAVLAVAGVTTAIVLGTSGPTGAAPVAFQPSPTAPSVASSVTPSTVAQTTVAQTTVGTSTGEPSTATTSASTSQPAPDPRPVPNPVPDPNPVPNPNPEPLPNPEPDPNPGPAAGPGPISAQTDNILAAAMAWMDARNAGDGQRVLQLGCLDDVDAVNSGQQNPAANAGSSSVRPTGKVAPIGSNNLAAYVEISQIDLHNGRTAVGTTPVIWENGGWHVCYYPGARAQAVAAQS